MSFRSQQKISDRKKPRWYCNKRAGIALVIIFASLQFGSTVEAQKKTIDLFDGKSLNGWEHYLVEPDLKLTDVWTVHENLLICKGEPMGYLVTKNEFTNFRLIVEWRWANAKPGGNSGVLMRITEKPRALPRCVEAQMQDGNAGAIFGFHGFPVKGDPDRLITNESELTGKLSGVSKIKGNEKEPGQWNKYDITLNNGDLTLIINGEKVNEAHDLEVIAGKIGLQSEGGEIHFRTIKLIPIDSNNSTPNYDWPQFHGPNRDNISLEKGLLASWPDEGPSMIWKASGLGHGFSSASIANDIIYTAGNIDGSTIITAINMEGNLLWQAKNGIAWTKSYPGTRSTPTIDGSRVYHQNPVGNIVCLNAKTGEIKWEKDILTEMGSKSSKWALAESLLIDGENLISCPGGPETCMLALNKKTGDIIWKAPSINQLAGYSSPILVEYQGKRIIITLTAKAIIGVDANNGELFWNVKHESYADENVMKPFYKNGSIFVSTIAAGSAKWKILVDNGKVYLNELWRTKDLDNHHGSVLFIDGYLYGTSTVKNRNQWVCLDWKTGETMYVTSGTGKSSLTYADGSLYTLSINRLVGLVKPTSSNFNVISTFEIPEGGEGLSWAHPVICNGRLYIRHGEFLYVYDVRQNSSR